MPILLDPDHMRTLVAIAETGSFTRAADEVHKAQSAVSMQMRRLEDQIGRSLFERDGRLSRLTPDGQRLVEYARRLLRLNDEAVGSFRAPGLSGHVCLELLRLARVQHGRDRLLSKLGFGLGQL